MKWQIPRGWSYLLFEHKNFKGDVRQLWGMGDLRGMNLSGWNDKVSSSRFVRSEITSMDEAWIELYDDSGFDDRRLVIDSFPREYRDYKTVTVESQRGFGDKVSSVRWQLPAGRVYRLYQHDNFRGDVFELVGTGEDRRGREPVVARVERPRVVVALIGSSPASGSASDLGSELRFGIQIGCSSRIPCSACSTFESVSQTERPGCRPTPCAAPPAIRRTHSRLRATTVWRTLVKSRARQAANFSLS